MQQVVLFSSDFSKESYELLAKELKRADELIGSNEGQTAEDLFSTHFKNSYDQLQIDISQPCIKSKDILERYKGLSLGLPEEWFRLKDRVEVTILQKNISITGNPASLALMPQNGTPVRAIVNEDYLSNSTLSLYFITNINYGNQESVTAFEQSCDEKVVQIQGNINLLNEEFKSFNEEYKKEVIRRINEVTEKVDS